LLTVRRTLGSVALSCLLSSTPLNPAQQTAAMSNYYADNTIHQQLLRDADPDEAAAQAQEAQQQLQQLQLDAQHQQQQQQLQDEDIVTVPSSTDTASAAAAAAPLSGGGVGSLNVTETVPNRGNTPSPALSRSSSSHHAHSHSHSLSLSSSSLAFNTAMTGGAAGGSGASFVPPLSFAGLSAVGSGPLSSTSAQQQQQQSSSAASSSLSTSYIPRSRRCIIGVCAMDKKTRSKPMTQILDRLRAYGEFEIILFGDKLILDDSISVAEWPHVVRHSK
jgi:hypothetical protein